jgi:hypothetical protein
MKLLLDTPERISQRSIEYSGEQSIVWMLGFTFVQPNLRVDFGFFSTR